MPPRGGVLISIDDARRYPHMTTNLTPAERSKLRIFRQVAAEARAAMASPRDAGEGFRVVNGYIESDITNTRVRNMCIPVRRAYLPSDPVNMRRIIAILEEKAPPTVLERVTVFRQHYAPIQQELDSASILNDRRVTHAEMFEVWIDAVVFHDIPAKRQPFLSMADELGKAVEGIGLHLAERIAERLIELDTVVADFLGEPHDSPAAAEESPSSQ